MGPLYVEVEAETMPRVRGDLLWAGEASEAVVALANPLRAGSGDSSAARCGSPAALAARRLRLGDAREAAMAFSVNLGGAPRRKCGVELFGRPLRY